MLLCPLSPPENWEPFKNEAERAELIRLLRRTEIKWAKRCLVALSVVVVDAVALIAFSVFSLF